ncbi:MAG: hypothetical protein ACRCYO_09695, partial [Bacteroidia bacterium]
LYMEWLNDQGMAMDSLFPFAINMQGGYLCIHYSEENHSEIIETNFLDLTKTLSSTTFTEWLVDFENKMIEGKFNKMKGGMIKYSIS